MANFDFPADLEISLAAKDIINRLLHPNPAKRPSIAEIREHPYFTGESVTPNLMTDAPAPPLPSSASGLIMSVKYATQRILSNYSGQGHQLERKSGIESNHASNFL